MELTEKQYIGDMSIEETIAELTDKNHPLGQLFLKVYKGPEKENKVYLGIDPKENYTII